jgi:hypothetical protein
VLYWQNSGLVSLPMNQPSWCHRWWCSFYDSYNFVTYGKEYLIMKLSQFLLWHRGPPSFPGKSSMSCNLLGRDFTRNNNEDIPPTQWILKESDVAQIPIKLIKYILWPFYVYSEDEESKVRSNCEHIMCTNSHTLTVLTWCGLYLCGVQMKLISVMPWHSGNITKLAEWCTVTMFSTNSEQWQYEEAVPEHYYIRSSNYMSCYLLP